MAFLQIITKDMDAWIKCSCRVYLTPRLLSAEERDTDTFFLPLDRYTTYY